MHGGTSVFPVHARRGAHGGAHLGVHAAHVGSHSRAVGPSTHLARAQPAGGHAAVGAAAPLAGHGVHGAAHAGTTGVVGVGHSSIARLPGVTWGEEEKEILSRLSLNTKLDSIEKNQFTFQFFF